MIDPIPFFSGSYILPRTIIGAAFPISKKGLINLKKLTKQIISIALGAVTAASCGTMAFAADKTLNQDTPSGSSTVEYSEVSTYTATIPEYIHPAELGEQNTSAYSISIDKAVIATGETVTASVSYDGMLETGDGAKLPYTLYSDAGAIVSGSKIIEKSAGSEDVATFSFGAALNERARYSGNYSDTATFSFSVKSNITEYTLDEINANEHLCAIGKTKPEYVVAQLNDDYTEVKISKNGKDSDGIMKDGKLKTVIDGISIDALGKLHTATILDGVVNIGANAFDSCSTLTNVTIPNSVTNIGESAFSGCSDLTDIIISDNDNVLSIGDRAFYACTKLANVTIPNSVENIGYEIFAGCTSLTDINIGSGVTNIDISAFYGCPKLTNINVDNSNLKYTSIDGVLFNNNKTILVYYPNNKGENYTIPDGVTTIGSGAFQVHGYNSSLISVTMPNSITTIGSGAFFGCSLLKNVIMSNKITTIEKNAFRNCSSLIDIILPNSITRIKDYAFKDCSSLKNIILPDGLSSISYAVFENCTSLQSITIPKSIFYIPDSSFEGCKNLNTVYGVSGSAAETWAKNNSYTFVAQ